MAASSLRVGALAGGFLECPRFFSRVALKPLWVGLRETLTLRTLSPKGGATVQGTSPSLESHARMHGEDGKPSEKPWHPTPQSVFALKS